MAKKIDINGFWDIKNNPLTKEGVFKYRGDQIDPEGKKWGLDQKRTYLVYRPLSEISKPETLKSFDGVPFIDEHDMLGEGCTPSDCKNIAGTIYNVHVEGQKMVGDFKIYSDNIKREIRNGKKELSLGYRASFEKRPGVFDGVPYDFVQVGIVGNHVALVNRGRCGSDVRIFDKSLVCDSMPMEVPSMNVIEEVKAVLDGLDEEKLAQVKEMLSKLEDEIKDEKSKDEKCEDKKSKDKKEDEKKDEKSEDSCKDGCKDEKNKMKDEGKKDEVKDEAVEEKKETVLDEAAVREDAIKSYKEAVKLHDELVPHIGQFVMDGMDTPQAVAEYGCKKLKLNVNAGSEIATLTGFLAGSKEKAEKVVTEDASAEKAEARKFDFKAAYLAN